MVPRLPDSVFLLHASFLFDPDAFGQFYKMYVGFRLATPACI